MQFDWSSLGSIPPTALVTARNLAHHAVQWATRAARANLDAAPDDSHSSLAWDVVHGALLSQPLPADVGEVRFGLRLASAELIVLRRGMVLDAFSLDGRRKSMVDVWFDSALRALGLKPAADIALPYTTPHVLVAKGGTYMGSENAAALEELARWYAAAADLLADFIEGLAVLHPGLVPGPGPVRCWPHHFDIATLVRLEAGTSKAARSIGVGISPGDESCPQPYLYVSPWPHLKAAGLPELPPPGHWHTQGYVAAVAPAEKILALADHGPELLAFVKGAFDVGRARLYQT
jgi:hypothetical protein